MGKSNAKRAIENHVLSSTTSSNIAESTGGALITNMKRHRYSLTLGDQCKINEGSTGSRVAKNEVKLSEDR